MTNQQPPATDIKLYTLREAAQMVPPMPTAGPRKRGRSESITKQCLYAYCAAGRIGQKIGTRWFLSAEHLAWFIEHGRAPIGQPRYKPTKQQRDLVAQHLADHRGDKTLSKRHREALQWRFGLRHEQMSLTAIGQAWGLSRERASQIVDEALRLVGLPDEVTLKQSA